MTGESLDLAFEGPAAMAVARLKLQIKHIHRGVSERWLPRYMSEAQHRENDVGCSFLMSAMATTRRRFTDIRPAFERWPQLNQRYDGPNLRL